MGEQILRRMPHNLLGNSIPGSRPPPPSIKDDGTDPSYKGPTKFVNPYIPKLGIKRPQRVPIVQPQKRGSLISCNMSDEDI